MRVGGGAGGSSDLFGRSQPADELWEISNSAAIPLRPPSSAF